MLKPKTKAILALALSTILTTGVFAQDNKTTPPDPVKLIAVLESDAPKAEKAISCKHLAVFGTKDAVPALAKLLPDKELTSWARIALEAIPDPSADDALRDALSKTEGRTQIGIINSIGVRRDAKAIEALAKKLNDSDPAIVNAAGVALGRIGGFDAAKALEQSLTAGSPPARAAVAEGAVLCAERFMLNNNSKEAARLYDVVRKTDLPRQRILEATRGAILARGNEGIPLLLEQLRNPDQKFFEIGLRVARELPGTEATNALVAEVPKSAPERRPLVILALGDRRDASSLPAIVEATRTGPSASRIAAASVLETMGNVSVVPALLESASGEDAEVAAAAKTTLARLRGKEIDADLFSRMRQSSGKMKQTLIPLVEQRRIEGAVPLFFQFANESDAAVRSVALDAIGTIGDDKHAGDLVAMLAKTTDASARGEIQRALNSICGRWGNSAAKYVLPLTKSDNPADRTVGLTAIASCGGPEALDTVKAAINDKEETVQDEAVRTLSNWPNRWPEDVAVLEPLMALAKEGKKPNHKILATRGYLQFAQGTKKLNNDQRLAKVNEVMPLVTRPEEKRLAISVLGSIRSGAALERLAEFTEDAAVAEEASSAIVNMFARNAAGIPRAPREKALKAVLEKSKSEATKKRAQELLAAPR